ncbi:hypothetical protein RclHR1_03500009 [Rhizophagus clarus]|uniref:Uncharacterized protein n=1 Tax=Rhizophagus clarus TaxID=94130 RepID=A0A2Z6RMK3_9GLOM|nr:hypothetical protein RclHR1_03500009 [Rhizophagus clarus]
MAEITITENTSATSGTPNTSGNTISRTPNMSGGTGTGTTTLPLDLQKIYTDLPTSARLFYDGLSTHTESLLLPLKNVPYTFHPERELFKSCQILDPTCQQWVINDTGIEDF